MKATRRVSLVEQKLPIFPKHMSLPPFSVRFVLLHLQFSMQYHYLSLFVLAIWLAARWITASSYPFDWLPFELRLHAIHLIRCSLNYGFKLSLWLAALWITASSYPFDWLPFELRLQAIPLVSSNISHWQTNAWSFIEYTSPWDGMEHLTNISNDRHRDPLPQCSTIYLGDRGLYFQFTWLICLTIV